MPHVSVVIPAYNSERFLKETLESVFAQTFADWELVIVDDGSTDGTAALVKEYALRDERVRLIQQENGGVAKALNRGFASAAPDSQYISMLGHDDLWEPSMLQTLVEALDQNPQYAAAYGNARYIDGAGAACSPGECENLMRQRKQVAGRKVMRHDPELPTTFEALVCYNCIPASGVVARRTILDQIELFDPDCVGAEDWDLWIRMSVLGDFRFIDRRLCSYRIHEGNLSKNKKMMENAEVVMLRKLLNSDQFSAAQKQALRIGYHYRLTTLNATNRLKWARGNFLNRQIVSGLKQLLYIPRDYLKAYKSPL